MRKRSTHLLVGLCWFGVAAVGQAQPTPAADSLARVLQQQRVAGKTRDTAYVRTLGRYAYKLVYEANDYPKADSVGRLAERLSRELADGIGVQRALVAQASAQSFLNHPQKTVQLFQQILTDIARYRLPPFERYRTLTNLSLAYVFLGQTKEALSVTMEAIRMEERYKFHPGEEGLRRTLASLFRQTGELDKAMRYVNEGLAIARENNSLSFLAILEAQKANIYSDQNDYANAVAAGKASLAYSRQGKYKEGQADALISMAYNYDALGQQPQALHCARQALAIANAFDLVPTMANAYYVQGHIYMSLKQYANAERVLKQALALGQQVGRLSNQVEYAVTLADVAELARDYRTAYTYLKLSQTLRDSLMNDEQKTRTDQLVAQYESEKKEAQIKLLQQDATIKAQEAERTQFRHRALLFGAVLTLLLGVALAAWLLNRAKLRRLQEAQTIRTQIAHDLHDEVGSTLSSISLLSDHTDKLLTQNRPEKAQQMVQKIYTDARQILEAIDEIIWTVNPSNDSMGRIALRLREYAQPLMDLKGIRLTYIADPTLADMPFSMESRRHLFLLCKEAINNLVKYSSATEATIRFERSGDQLSVLIDDNGQGFQADATRPSRTGQVSMQHRAEAIGGKLVIESAPGKGTRMKMAFTG